uniref:Transcription repressor n=1 Tax=Oryza brachyantha TaxID=4533 RepID=J3L224_ORYBR
MHTPFVDKSPQCRRDGVGAGGWLKQRLAQILRPKVDGTARHRRPRRRNASFVHISIDCTGGAGATSGRRSVRSDAPLLPSSARSLPTKDGRRQSRARRNPRSPSTSRRHCPSSSWGLARLPRGAPGQYSCSSSTVTDDELAPFSTDEEGGEEAETRTLFSSLSFSSDSTSEFYHTNSSSSLARKGHKNVPRRPPPRRASTRTTSDPADAFRPVVSVAATKQHNEYFNDKRKEEKTIKKQLGEEEEDAGADVGAGMAVVKRSSNPYADFRSSMVEMVVERRICSVPEMEELLGSYLSLNSPQHHPAILAAFEDVWEAVFGEE